MERIDRKPGRGRKGSPRGAQERDSRGTKREEEDEMETNDCIQQMSQDEEEYEDYQEPMALKERKLLNQPVLPTKVPLVPASLFRPYETQPTLSTSPQTSSTAASFGSIPSTSRPPLDVVPSMTDVGQQVTNAWGFSLPQMPNLGVPQFSPNLTDYFPNITTSIPFNVPSMPSMPSFSMPSMSIPSFPSLIGPRPGKTWNELKESVRNAHRRLAEISSKVPFGINFRPLEVDNGMRVYFLSQMTNSSETTLLYCDVIEGNLKTEEKEKPNPHRRTQSDPTAGGDAWQRQGRSDGQSGRQSAASGGKPAFEWKPLIETRFRKFRERGLETQLNHQEKLQLERKRIMLSGITSYEFDVKSRRFVFSSGGNLYYFDDSVEPPYSPIRLETSLKSAKINPQICPSNPDLIAFVCDADIWVSNVKSGQEMRLTETKLVEGRALSAGLPCYVIQEEFRRYLGFWWRPDSEYHQVEVEADPEAGAGDGSSSGSSQTSSLGRLVTYELLYEEVDETNVEVVKIASWDGSVEEYRFPRPGGANAISVLKLLSFKFDMVTNQVVETNSKPIPGISSLHSLYSDYEYLARCGWFGYDNIWVQLLNRKQNNLVLAMGSLSNSYPAQIIHEENSGPVWLNVSDVLHFTGEANALRTGSHLSFIWASETTGFRHLYLLKVQLQEEKPETAAEAGERIRRGPGGGPNDFIVDDSAEDKGTQGPGSPSPSGTKPSLKSLMLEKKQLTSGNWQVSDKDVWLDIGNQLVYFVASKESPLERHLYVISLNKSPAAAPASGLVSTPIKRLTDSGFSHSIIAFDSSFKYFVNIQSNIAIPPFGYVNKTPEAFFKPNSPKRRSRDVSGSACPSLDSTLPEFNKIGLIITHMFHSQATSLPSSSTSTTSSSSTTTIPPSVEQLDLLPGLAKPELITYQLQRTRENIYGIIFKPEFMEKGVKYPCVVDIYGGPEVQIVVNSFKGVRHVRRHLLSTEGYVVCAFDCRGSHNRGTAFEGHINRRMGQVEIEDQVEVLQWLASRPEYDYIDMKRVAVHGWSYGGYLSLMALAQRPDVFKLGIAGAPVTNWSLYDTGYTERYMDLPLNNPEGYLKGNVLHYINQFPDQENRLLIIHGLMDENVHFSHSLELIQSLIKAGKPYQLQVYPFERHSLRNSPCCEHYETYLVSFLQQHL